jgi:hypothetical protein
MPALRIATAGAALLVLTAGSTIAQPTGTATSKPISILKILAPSDNAKIKPHGQGAVVAAESAPSALVVGGRAVQVLSPDDANEIDLAADAPEVAASKGPRSDIAAAQPPEAETVAVARAPSPAGTSAWVAQLLAAIGGAMAAASVAWFLIGSAPQRTYD